MYENQHLADKIAGRITEDKPIAEQNNIAQDEIDVESLCLLLIDLTIAESVNDAIQFGNEQAFDNFAEEIRAEGRKNGVGKYYEVGIKQKDNSITTETFDDFKKRFDFKKQTT